jgi:hypothetical protein
MAEHREMRAEIERLTGLLAEWETHAGPYKDAEVERLTEALTDIASDICSRGGAVAIAKDALAGKTREEWS